MAGEGQEGAVRAGEGAVPAGAQDEDQRGARRYDEEAEEAAVDDADAVIVK